MNIVYRQNIRIILLFSGVLLFSCEHKKKDKPLPNVMQLVKEESVVKQDTGVNLNAVLKPTNQFVISRMPVTTLQQDRVEIEIQALGSVAYDTRQVGTISARVSGRIEKLYVRYRFQKISKGQRIMDIYSPELMTAEQHLLFLLKNDAANVSLIDAAKEKLRLLGLTAEQTEQVIRSGQPSFTTSIFSNYSGHIHEAINGVMNNPAGEVKDVAIITEELSLKEGMYIQKGQPVFTVYNPGKAWALLNIYVDWQAFVEEGNVVQIVPETSPEKSFRASISFVEPFFRKENKTMTARVAFDNSALQIPIGSQVKATIFGNTADARWLPAESVHSLGLDQIVFLNDDGGFRAHKVETGMNYKGRIQVTGGLGDKDTVAANAQFLMDSESFIKVKE